MSDKNPYILILGGTSGLGAAIAEEYERRNKAILILGRTAKDTMHNGSWPVKKFDPKNVHELGERVGPPPKRFEIPIDLANGASVYKIFEILNHLSMCFQMSFPTLYWCAGILKRSKLEESDGRDLYKMIDVNLRGPVMLVRNLRTEPRTTGGAFHLVTVASTTGLSDSPRQDEAVYAATKAAQVSFARAVGKGNTDRSFKVSLFCPGGMQTPFWKNEPDVDTSSFLDPKKVAAAIVKDVEEQTDSYYERVIPRGSL